MDSKEFKNIFNEAAKINGFQKAHSGWFAESAECIVVLDLQKSNYGDYYELNIKIFVQKMFGKDYTMGKDLVKKQPGHILTRQPDNYKDILDFDLPMDDLRRKEKLESLFSEFITPFTIKALTKAGIKELANEKIISLLPSVSKGLE